MGPRNRVLDGGPQVLRDVAMATNFWLSVGYNFGCVTASDMRALVRVLLCYSVLEIVSVITIIIIMMFHSRGGFLGSSYPMKT